MDVQISEVLKLSNLYQEITKGIEESTYRGLRLQKGLLQTESDYFNANSTTLIDSQDH